MNLHQIIEQHWQTPNPVLRLILLPFSKLFALIAAKRRARFLSGSLNTQKLPIPLIIIGNIHAGGVGKTPITAALVSALQARGVKMGIISRGYGRQSKQIIILNQNSTADEAGDEPLMLFRQTAAPTAVGANRYETGMTLLSQYPDLQCIISDDGLQHYALARDVEICVFPAADVGRDDLDVLPNGGLREAVGRLQAVDFMIISNGDNETVALAKRHLRLPENVFFSQIQTAAPYRLTCPTEQLTAPRAHETYAAIAAIARPQRFFNTLNNMGFHLQTTRILPDHAAMDRAQLPIADCIFITEKDAAKLSPADAPENVWVLPITAQIPPDLVTAVYKKIFKNQ